MIPIKERKEDALIIGKEDGQPRYMRIVAETSRSWVSSWHKSTNPLYSEKIPKSKWRIATDEERHQYEWLWEHRAKIAEAVKGVRSYDQLKQIADIIGYKDGAL